MQRDDYSNFKYFQCIMPQELVATDLTGAAIDTQGFESLTIVVNVGNISDITSTSYIGFILEHTDASALGAGPSGYAVCASADFIGLVSTQAVTSGIWRTIGAEATGGISAGLGSQTFQIGYRGNKRYVRLIIDANDTLDSAQVGAIAILGYPANWPVNEEMALDKIA